MSAYSSLILGESSLLAYWRLDEASGSFLDSKGSNTATIVGTPTHGATGLLTGDSDTAASTAGGTANYAQVAASLMNALPITTAMTLEFWIKITALDTVTVAPIGCSGNNNRFYIRYYSSGDITATSSRWEVNFYDTSLARNSFSTSVAAGNIAVAGLTQHVVMTYDSVTHKMKLYLNGFDASQPPSSGTQTLAIYAGDSFANMFLLYGSGGSAAINGTLDEVAIYNTALTPQQVGAHYYTGLNQPVISPTARSVSAASATMFCPVAAPVYGFPTAPVLDNFNRNPESVLSNGGQWITGWYAGGALKTNGTQALTSTPDGNFCGNAWSTLYSLPTEAYYDVPALPPASPARNLNLQWENSPTDSVNGVGYFVSWVSGSPWAWTIYRNDGPSGSTSLATGTAPLAAGDSIGLSIAVNGVITAWRKPSGGSWAAVGTAFDTAHIGGGAAGYWLFGSNSSATLFDNFGGGISHAVAASVSAATVGPMTVPQRLLPTALSTSQASATGLFTPVPVPIGSPFAFSLARAVAAISYPMAIGPQAQSVSAAAVTSLYAPLVPGLFIQIPIDGNHPPPGFIRALQGITRAEWTYDWKSGNVYYDQTAQGALNLPVPLFNVLTDPGFDTDPTTGAMPASWATIDNGTTRMIGQVGTSWSASGGRSLQSSSQFSGAPSGSNGGINVALAYLAEALPGSLWSARCRVYIWNVPSPSTGLQLGVRFYDVTQTFIAATYAPGVSTIGDNTLSLQAAVAPPATAYVQFTVRAFVTGTGSGVMNFSLDECVLCNASYVPPNVYFEGSSPQLATLCVDGYGALRAYKGNLRPGQMVPDPDIP